MTTRAYDPARKLGDSDSVSKAPHLNLQMPHNGTRTSAPSEVLRIGIVGAGQMAAHHAQAIGRLENAVVSAFVDPDPSALVGMRRLHPGATLFPSVDELLQTGSVDVVHICTPPHTHETLTEEVLRAGVHVYVEKPFVETSAAAKRLARLADRSGLKICAGHQLLYEPPTRRALQLLPTLGELTHIESYFSFRAIKHTPTGRAPMRDDLQLIDILPHPVYVLLQFLERAAEGETRLMSVQIGPRGTVHALVRRGSLTGTLVVTLEGRPVENYLRISGTNGSVYADYVRSTVQRNVGPGASGIDKLLSPYRLAGQLLSGTTAAMGRRFLKRQKSYPGLAEIFDAFYEAIKQDRESPVSRANLIETVAVCEQIATELRAVYAKNPPFDEMAGKAPVVITGGTGFLGREIAREMIAAGEAVRVVARRAPADWDRIPGVNYVVADVSKPIVPEVMSGAKAIVHCAAETAGGWEQHDMNSVRATDEVLTAASVAKVKRVIHISSISVLAVPRRGHALADNGVLEPNSRSGGPYAWGKIESERLAVRRCNESGIDLRVVRPSALIDKRHFDPPGLLGKRIGNIFVAVGMPGHQLGVVDVVFSAQAIVWMVRHFEDAPKFVNLFEPNLPTKGELLDRLRLGNPDLAVVWLPPVALYPLSWLAFAIQKLVRPRRPAINVAKIFARLRYDTSSITSLEPLIRGDAPQTGTSEPEAIASPFQPRGIFEDNARVLA